MRKDRRFQMLYCSVCKITTYWELIDGSHWCVGSDKNHPERRLHGPRESGRQVKICEAKKDDDATTV